MAYYNWENKNKLIEDLKNSASISNFLDNQGLVASSGNYDTFKKWMKKHEIDAKDYLTNKISYSPINRNLNKSLDQLTRDEVLCVNSKYDRKEANKIIKREGLMPYICSGCSNHGFWNNKPLTLQLEHKNGNSSDHRLENLEYLCPNCHSQTNTYGSKNKHNNVFEERIKDLSECGVTEITNVELEILAEKWSRTINSVHSWINKYSEKIQEVGITLNLKKLARKSFTKLEETNESIKKQREKDIELIKNDKEFEQSLSEKWHIPRKEVRDWLRVNSKIFYADKYIVSSAYKASNYQNNIYEKIAQIILSQKVTNHYDYKEMLPLFNMNSGSCSVYLKNKFPEYHRKYFLVKNCSHCHSIDVKKNGMELLFGMKQQRYKCKECNKNFY